MSTREWVVTVGDVDAEATQPAVFRTYSVTPEQAEAVMSMLGEADETTIFGERAHKAASEAYDAGIHL